MAFKGTPIKPGHAVPLVLLRSVHHREVSKRTKVLKLFSRHKSIPSTDQEHSVTSEQGVVFWPVDLLPVECKEARILTWVYDTTVTKGYAGAVNKSNIFAHAKDLLFALNRDHTPNRPLVFVAHSLGGILVKEVSFDALFVFAPPQPDAAADGCTCA
jgi:hypothetical protein